jgi:hypothetical protein
MGADGTIWLSNAGSPGGIAYLSRGEKQFRYIKSEIRDIALHPDGSVWLTGAKGIRVITVAADGADGTVWATAFNEGVLRLRAAQTAELNATPKRIEILHHSAPGELWAAGVGGVWRRRHHAERPEQRLHDRRHRVAGPG